MYVTFVIFFHGAPCEAYRLCLFVCLDQAGAGIPPRFVIRTGIRQPVDRHLHQGGAGDFSAAEIATSDAVYEVARGQRMRKK